MVNWDDANEKQLLLSIIHVLQPTPASITWSTVAAAIGEDCTEEACKQKLKKLRAAAKEKFGEPPVAMNEDGTPKTPASKRGGKKTAAGSAGDGGSKSSGGKRKAKKGGEGDGEGETPTKKVKSEERVVEGAEEGAGVKVEGEEEANGEA